jgi:chemotaxis methyl-accepting protein methylase
MFVNMWVPPTLKARQPKFSASHFTPSSVGNIHHDSSFFGDRYLFEALPAYLSKRFPTQQFPRGLKLNMSACAEGEDVWSLVMSLKAAEKTANLPKIIISAGDIVQNAINIAKTGILYCQARTIEKVKGFIPQIHHYFLPETPEQHDQTLREYQKLLELAGFRQKKRQTLKNGDSKRIEVRVEPGKVKSSFVHRVSPELVKEVSFESAQDVLRIMEKSRWREPRIFVFRDAMQHFPQDKRKRYAQAAFKALKPGSVFIIGSGDVSRGVGSTLIEAGFIPANPKWSLEDYKRRGPMLVSKAYQEGLTLIFERN